MVSEMFGHDIFPGNLGAFVDTGEIQTLPGRLGRHSESYPACCGWMFLDRLRAAIQHGRKLGASLGVLGGPGALHTSTLLLRPWFPLTLYCIYIYILGSFFVDRL